MRALIVPERGRVEMADVPRPEIGPYQAMVKNEVCGICSSTDWKIINGQMPWAGPFPLVLGHESVGRVTDVGSKVRRFKVGDRVTRTILPKTTALNTAMGGFAEYGIITDTRAMAADGDESMLGDYNADRQQVVPEAITDPVQAALSISLSETASALAGLPNLRTRRVLVAGTGVAGLAITLWCKLAGAHVTVVGRRPERLKAARELGADEAVTVGVLGGLEIVDGVIEAVGDVAFAEQLLKHVKPDGFAFAYGAPPDGKPYGARWRVTDVREHETYPWVWDLLTRRVVRAESFISHTWEFEQAPAAFEQVRNGEVLKGFVRISQDKR